jgi:hypothetical protein
MSKFCTSCGAALEEGQQFCGSCGKPAQDSGTAETPPVQTSAPVSLDEANIAAKSGQKLWVFGVVLGWLGVHCFTTGKKKRGTLELLLGLIVAAFSILSLVQLSNGNTSWVFQALPYVFGALFCAFWIPDLIGIVKGTFTNGPDKVPGFIDAVLPEWKFTKKHLVFIALLAGLEIVLGVMGYIPILSNLLRIPSVLCGVFFGPLLGTVIAGVLPLISSLIVSFFKHGWFIDIQFPTPLSFILPFVRGYIVYGIPKIRSLRDKQVFSNNIAQGLLIGIAVLFASFFGRGRWYFSFYLLLDAALAGVVGVLLPLVLAKKGLLLGPFVKEGERPQSSTDVKQAKEF